MLKIRIIGFFFENGLHWQFEVERKFLQTAVLGCLFIYAQTIHQHIIPYTYFKIWGGGNI